MRAVMPRCCQSRIASIPFITHLRQPAGPSCPAHEVSLINEACPKLARQRREREDRGLLILSMGTAGRDGGWRRAPQGASA